MIETVTDLMEETRWLTLAALLLLVPISWNALLSSRRKMREDNINSRTIRERIVGSIVGFLKHPVTRATFKVSLILAAIAGVFYGVWRINNENRKISERQKRTLDFEVAYKYPYLPIDVELDTPHKQRDKHYARMYLDKDYRWQHIYKHLDSYDDARRRMMCNDALEPNWTWARAINKAWLSCVTGVDYEDDDHFDRAMIKWSQENDNSPVRDNKSFFKLRQEAYAKQLGDPELVARLAQVIE